MENIKVVVRIRPPKAKKSGLGADASIEVLGKCLTLHPPELEEDEVENAAPLTLSTPKTVRLPMRGRADPGGQTPKSQRIVVPVEGNTPRTPASAFKRVLRTPKTQITKMLGARAIDPNPKARFHMPHGYNRNRGKPKSFEFDKVLGPEATQSDCFAVVRPYVEDAVAGYNACVFAYGQTGSGKTYTMMNPRKSDGIIPQVVAQLFDLAEARSQSVFDFRMTYVELYNNELRDLLGNIDPEKPERKQKKHVSNIQRGPVSESRRITVHEKLGDDGAKEVYLAGPESLQTRVTTPEFAWQCIRHGSIARASGSTKLNEESSRSHTILTFHIECRSASGDGEATRGKLHLVDLAGSENVNQSEAEGERKKETAKINQSLTHLGDVLNALSTQKLSVIPYRNCKLTHILSDSLGGNSRTVMIACVRADLEVYRETLQTLSYAQRAKHVQNRSRLNQFFTEGNLKMRVLQHDMHTLQQSLASRTEELNLLKDIDTYSSEHIRQQRRLLEALTQQSEVDMLRAKEDCLRRDNCMETERLHTEWMLLENGSSILAQRNDMRVSRIESTVRELEALLETAQLRLLWKQWHENTAAQGKSAEAQHERELQAQIEERQRFEMEVKSVRAELKAAIAARDDSEQRAKEELDSQHKEWQAVCAEDQRQMEEDQTKLQDLEAAVQKCKEGEQHMQADLEGAMETIKRLQERERELRDEIERKDVELSALRATFEDNSAAADRLRAELDEKTIALDKLKPREQELESEVALCNAKLDELRQVERELHAELQRQMEQNSRRGRVAERPSELPSDSRRSVMQDDAERLLQTQKRKQLAQQWTIKASERQTRRNAEKLGESVRWRREEMEPLPQGAVERHLRVFEGDDDQVTLNSPTAELAVDAASRSSPRAVSPGGLGKKRKREDMSIASKDAAVRKSPRTSKRDEGLDTPAETLVPHLTDDHVTVTPSTERNPAIADSAPDGRRDAVPSSVSERPAEARASAAKVASPDPPRTLRRSGRRAAAEASKRFMVHSTEGTEGSENDEANQPGTAEKVRKSRKPRSKPKTTAKSSRPPPAKTPRKPAGKKKLFSKGQRDLDAVDQSSITVDLQQMLAGNAFALPALKDIF